MPSLPQHLCFVYTTAQINVRISRQSFIYCTCTLRFTIYVPPRTDLHDTAFYSIQARAHDRDPALTTMYHSVSDLHADEYVNMRLCCPLLDHSSAFHRRFRSCSSPLTLPLDFFYLRLP